MIDTIIDGAGAVCALVLTLLLYVYAVGAH